MGLPRGEVGAHTGAQWEATTEHQKGAPAMSVPSSPPVATTEHGLLVPFGSLAKAIGLREALGRVPFKMKTIDHSPGDKLAGLLVQISRARGIDSARV